MTKIVAIQRYEQDKLQDEIFQLQKFPFWQRLWIEHAIRETSPTLRGKSKPNIINIIVSPNIEDHQIVIYFTQVISILCVLELTYPKHLVPSLVKTCLNLTIPLNLVVEQLGDDKLRQIQENLDEVQNVMRENISAISDRGQNINELVIKAEELEDLSRGFIKKTKDVDSCCSIF